MKSIIYGGLTTTKSRVASTTTTTLLFLISCVVVFYLCAFVEVGAGGEVMISSSSSNEGGVFPLIAGFSVSSTPSPCNGLQIALFSNQTTVGSMFSIMSLPFQNPNNVFIGSAIDTFYRTVYTYIPMVSGGKNRLGSGGWLAGLQFELIQEPYAPSSDYIFIGGLLTAPFVSTLQPSAMVYEPLSKTVWVVAQVGLRGGGVVAAIDPVHGNYSIIYEIPKDVFSVVNPTPSVLNPVSNTFSFFMDISPVGYLVTISTKDYSAVTLQPVHYHNSTSIALCGLANWDVDPTSGRIYGLCLNSSTEAYWLSELNLETATHTPIGQEPMAGSNSYVDSFGFAINWRDRTAYALQSPESHQRRAI